MVAKQKLAMDEGPKPPRMDRHAVKANQFNADWRKELRQAPGGETKRTYETFARSAGKGMGH